MRINFRPSRTPSCPATFRARPCSPELGHGRRNGRRAHPHHCCVCQRELEHGPLSGRTKITTLSAVPAVDHSPPCAVAADDLGCLLRSDVLRHQCSESRSGSWNHDSDEAGGFPDRGGTYSVRVRPVRKGVVGPWSQSTQVTLPLSDTTPTTTAPPTTTAAPTTTTAPTTTDDYGDHDDRGDHDDHDDRGDHDDRRARHDRSTDHDGGTYDNDRWNLNRGSALSARQSGVL